MRLELKKFFSGEQEPERIDCAVDLSATELDGVHPFSDPVRVEGEIRATPIGVQLQLTARYAYEMPCARCLKPVRCERVEPLTHLLVRESETEPELSEDCIPVSGDFLDLDELVYSDILLLMPAKILCREDCKGLCPTCGKDLNEGPCGCVREAADPRLDALKELLKTDGD